jgi:hypothetical protein
MRSTVLESLEDFQDYEEAWEALRLECRAPIFSSYDLVRLWLDNFKAQVKPHIVLVEDKGELIGAAPMCTSHARVMALPMDSISMVGNLFPLHSYSLYSVLAKEDDPETIREILKCVKRAKWNKLVMSHMEPNNSTLRFLDGIVQMWEGQSSSLNQAINHTYIFPDGGSIAAGYEKNTRGNLLRMRAKMEKDGRIELRKVGSVEDAERAMNLYLSQHDERWEHRDSVYRIQGNRRLVVELGKIALATGMGGINELLIDGEVAGQVSYFLDGAVARGVHLGMNNKFRSFSPGMLVLMLTMEDNRSRGLRAYDPGYGNESYKLRMTNNHYPLGSALVYKGAMEVISRIRTSPPMRVLESRLKLEDVIERLSQDQVGNGL